MQYTNMIQIITSTLTSIVVTFGFICASIYLNKPIDFIEAICFGGITFWIYGLNKLTDKEDKQNIESVFKYKKLWFLLINSILILSLFYLIYNRLFNWFHCIVILLSVFYSVKIFNKRLKDIFIVKNLIISFTFGPSFILLNIINWDVAINQELILLMICGIFVVWINTIFCDIRDISGDHCHKIKTIPLVMGEKNTIQYFISAPTLIFLFIFITIVSNKMMIFMLLNLSFPIIYFIMYYTNRNKFITTIVADSSLLLYSIMMLMIK